MRNFKKFNLVRSGATSCFSAELFSEASRSGAKLVGILRPQLEQLRPKEIHVGDLGPVTRKDRKPPVANAIKLFQACNYKSVNTGLFFSPSVAISIVYFHMLMRVFTLKYQILQL